MKVSFHPGHRVDATTPLQRLAALFPGGTHFSLHFSCSIVLEREPPMFRKSSLKLRRLIGEAGRPSSRLIALRLPMFGKLKFFL
jgi:hypothetical protein